MQTNKPTKPKVVKTGKDFEYEGIFKGCKYNPITCTVIAFVIALGVGVIISIGEVYVN